MPVLMSRRLADPSLTYEDAQRNGLDVRRVRSSNSPKKTRFRPEIGRNAAKPRANVGYCQRIWIFRRAFNYFKRFLSEITENDGLTPTKTRPTPQPAATLCGTPKLPRDQSITTSFDSSLSIEVPCVAVAVKTSCLRIAIPGNGNHPNLSDIFPLRNAIRKCADAMRDHRYESSGPGMRRLPNYP